MGVEIGGGDRLHDVVDLVEAEAAERGFVALLCQRRVGVRPREFDRPPEDKTARQALKIAARRAR